MYIPILCLIKKYSHTVAHKANTHRAYEKSQHAEDFGCIKINSLLKIYSPFHSSLPFEHLGQSNLSTRVCRLFVNQVTFYSILELKQCPRCQVFLKSIQHLSLGNYVTSSDENIVIAWLKHIFISKFFAEYIQCIFRTHICNRIETKAEFYQFKQLPDRYLHGKNSRKYVKILLEFAVFKGHLVSSCHSNQQINQSICL